MWSGVVSNKSHRDSCKSSGRGDGGPGGPWPPQLFAKMKFLEPLLFYFGISKVNT